MIVCTVYDDRADAWRLERALLPYDERAEQAEEAARRWRWRVAREQLESEARRDAES